VRAAEWAAHIGADGRPTRRGGAARTGGDRAGWAARLTSVRAAGPTE